MPKLSVILTTFEDDHRLNLALAGYARQESAEFEIIVANDGGRWQQGRDETERLVRSYERQLDIRYVYVGPESMEFRLAKARNAAIRVSRGETLVISDGDCVPGPGLLASIAAAARQDRVLVGVRKRIHESLVECLGPSDIPFLGNLAYSEDRRLSDATYSEVFRRMTDSVPPDSWALCWGCLFAAPAGLVRSIGGFDERFRQWGREDEDLAERLARGAGCRFLAMPEAFVYHLDHEDRTGGTRTRELLSAIRSDWTVVRNGGPLI
jgi:GT2 family glycosyltransferase